MRFAYLADDGDVAAPTTTQDPYGPQPGMTEPQSAAQGVPYTTAPVSMSPWGSVALPLIIGGGILAFLLIKGMPGRRPAYAGR